MKKLITKVKRIAKKNKPLVAAAILVAGYMYLKGKTDLY